MARPLRVESERTRTACRANHRSAVWGVPVKSWPAVCVNPERCAIKSRRSRPPSPLQNANRRTDPDCTDCLQSGSRKQRNHIRGKGAVPM